MLSALFCLITLKLLLDSWKIVRSFPVPSFIWSLSAISILLPLLAKSPPSCGDVSFTRSVTTAAQLKLPLASVVKN